MDAMGEPEQGDPREKVRAHALAMQQAGTPPEEIKRFIDGALAGLSGASPDGPITSGHSKFTPAELVERADRSVEDATQETMDAQGDLIHTLQAGVGIAGAVPEIAAIGPALVRSGGNVVRAVAQNAPAMKDIALSPVSRGARMRVLGRVIEKLRNSTSQAGPAIEGVEPPIGSVLRGREVPVSRATPVPRPTPEIPHTVDRPIETQSALESVLNSSRRVPRVPTAPRVAPQTEVPQTMERPIPTESPIESALQPPSSALSPRATAKRSLEQLLQKNVDEGQAAYEASLHKGVPTADTPTNWDLMRRMEAGLLKAAGRRPRSR